MCLKNAGNNNAHSDRRVIDLAPVTLYGGQEYGEFPNDYHTTKFIPESTGIISGIDEDKSSIQHGAFSNNLVPSDETKSRVFPTEKNSLLWLSLEEEQSFDKCQLHVKYSVRPKKSSGKLERDSTKSTQKKRQRWKRL